MGALWLLADPLAASARGSPPPTEDATAPPGEAGLLLVAVSINGAEVDCQILAARDGDAFFVRRADLDRWRIRRPPAEAAIFDGEAYVPLSALPQIAARFDAPRQRLVLTVPADLFEARRLSASAPRPLPTGGAFAAFLNYDLAAEYRDGLRANALLEAGVSHGASLIASTLALGRGTGGRGATRLDSYYLRDDPSSLTRLVVGDSVTDAHAWTRQIRFGGVRWGTDFSLQPGLVTFPTPRLAGRTAVPSDVELLVNDGLRFQTQVDQGPFSIDQLPVITGAGEVTLVTRDALGVERRVTSPYYVSSRLLSPGLSDWSVEAGAERRDYGIKSVHYANPFAAGSFRRGINDWLTVESRAELSADVRLAGAGLSLVRAPLGEFSVAGAASEGRDGAGGLYRLDFTRISFPWDVALSYQHATRDFGQLGIGRDQDRITDQFQAAAGFSHDWGTVGLAYTDVRYADAKRAWIASGNYSVGIGGRGYLSLFALRSRVEGLGPETNVGAGLTIPLGPRSSAYVQADSRNVTAEARLTPPVDGGWGYRLAASHGETGRQQAGLEWRGDMGEVSLEAARFRRQEGVRMLASGGLLWAGGGLRAARRVEEAIGVVDVAGLPNVRILQENRVVARTDEHGRAILPDLRAYDENRIAIAPSDLPLDARMPTDTLLLVPRFRGAAIARFAIGKDNPATVLLHDPNGKAVEAGTSVRSSTGERLFVGHGGEAFVANASSGMSLLLDLADGPCRAVVREVPRAEVLPRIGPLRCVREGGRQ